MTGATHTTDAEQQETIVGHCKRDQTDTYIGRGPDARNMANTPIGERGWLGNPFPLNEGYSREESIELFEEQFVLRLINDDEFTEAVAELAGDTLGCWCQSVHEDGPACHGEVIAQWADKLAPHY